MDEVEKSLARYHIKEIYDNLLSISNEVYNVDQPFKPYLLEKLEKIKIDIDCLIFNCKEE